MLELLQAVGLTQSHSLPARKLPALFVHANKDLEQELLMRAAQLWQAGCFENLVLNGMTEAECREQKINYAGVEPWQQWLTQEGTVPASAILRVKPGRHTYEEAQAVQRLCACKGWRALAFLSFPYHILRCALTQLAAMQGSNFYGALYPVSLEAVSWFEPVTKQVLGEHAFTRPPLDMFEEEWQRIQKYQMQGDCVSLEALITFFKRQHDQPPSFTPEEGFSAGAVCPLPAARRAEGGRVA